MEYRFERREYINKVCEALQHNYVAMLGQRGTGLQTFLDTLSSPPAFKNMQFLSITMPEVVAYDENSFNSMLLKRLLEEIEHLPSGKSLRIEIEKSINEGNALNSSTRLWLAFEEIGRKTNARPLVIVLQAFSHLPPEQLNKFLLALRDYHRQINGKGDVGKHLRFLVAGDLRLWFLSLYREDDKQTVPSSPFDYATRIFFDGLSYQEIDALSSSSDIKHAIYVKNLTDGIPNFVQKVRQLKPSSNTLRPFFRFLEKRWNHLPERSQQALKRFAENPNETLDYGLDYDCLPIPKLSSPWLEAFWQGFLRVRFRKITWRSPIHRAFVMEKQTYLPEDISKNTMMRLHQLEGLRDFTQLISHIFEEENLEDYLDDALLLTVPTPGALLAPLLKELCLGADRQELISQTRELVINTDKYWLKQILEDFYEKYVNYDFMYFLVTASIWEARRLLDDFDIHLYYDAADILTVTDIAEQLLTYGILPWLDSWELPHDQHAQLPLIPHGRPLAVFFGKNSMDTVQLLKLEEFLSLYRRQGDATIAVILENASEHSQLPPMLSEAKCIDGRKHNGSVSQQLKALIKKTLFSGKPITISPVKSESVIDSNTLRTAMHQAYNFADLKLLCANLKARYEDLAGNNLETTILNIIEHFQRHGKYDELVSQVLKERPHLKDKLEGSSV